MIFFLINVLQSIFGIQVPAVFEYYSTRMLLSAITALSINILFGPWFIKKLSNWKIGQPIRKEESLLLGKLHEKKEDTPTMGGLLILASMLISMLLWMDLTHIFTLILFITTIFLGGVGCLDDILKLMNKSSQGLSMKKKFIFQTIFSVILIFYLFVPQISEFVAAEDRFDLPTIKEYVEDVNAMQRLSLQEYMGRLYVPFFKNPVFQFEGVMLVIPALLVVFVILGCSNGVNLTDGLDGLAAGSLIMVATCLSLIAFVSNHINLAKYLHIPYVEGSGEIAIYLLAFIGACIGFLWYNCHPAQIFMGDTGSLALGGILGVSTILLKRELLLVIIGGIFVVEALSVILQVGSYRFRNKKRIFLCAPLHHHFEFKGLPESKVVIRFWIVGLLLAIIGIASLKFQ